jgi:FMN-dependent NADH-azoreductase
MNILIVRSSAQGAASISNRLAAGLVDRLRDADPGVEIVERDVGRQPLPHLTEDTVAGIRADANSATEIATRDLSDALLAEVRAADLVVIASPMYNFGISSTLKTWFDYVLRPRVSFRYGASGPEGLLGPRKVLVIESRAGAYAEGNDFQSQHLTAMLSFAGLGDITYVRAEGLAFDAPGAIARAEAELDRFADRLVPLAA